MKKQDNPFKLHSDFTPAGDQPKAIDQMVENINKGVTDTVLLGVTGSGKTYTMANVIEKVQRPTLVISHNKTLAGQLFQEFRDFFPNNAVEYFVSYYDYYQPESYIPSSDTYIEKEADRNDEIDRLRLSATTSLSTRRDTLVVSSVSCIYNLGSPVEYGENVLRLAVKSEMTRKNLLESLLDMGYERNDIDLQRSTYRVQGDTVDIVPGYEEYILRITIFNDKIENIQKVEKVSGEVITNIPTFILYPAKHYIAAEGKIKKGLKRIKKDLKEQLDYLKSQDKHVEAYRLKQRTLSDVEMINEFGYCSGIENYSVYFDDREVGDPPFTLLDYFDDDYLLIIDESHITVPQIRGMYAGDRSRKETLVDYGFRLPTALDNRPLRFDEFQRRMGENSFYISATPKEYEIERSIEAASKVYNNSPTNKDSGSDSIKYSEVSDSNGVVELIVRPTGLLDPKVEVRPTKNQVKDLIKEIEETTSKGQRVLVTALTKRMSEELTDYLEEKGIKVAYLHSDIETLDRSDILTSLRKGEYDVVVGVNLLREGLDLPEVSLVAILDADKEGFLRSETSLIQTMGRAARHKEGRSILYADEVTGSMQRAIDEVERRREIQQEYNEDHNIEPETIKKPVRDVIIKRDKKSKKKKDIYTEENVLEEDLQVEQYEYRTMSEKDQKRLLSRLNDKMQNYANALEYERASVIRDKIRDLRSNS